MQFLLREGRGSKGKGLKESLIATAQAYSLRSDVIFQICFNWTFVVFLLVLVFLPSPDNCCLLPASTFLTIAMRTWPEVKAQGGYIALIIS